MIQEEAAKAVESKGIRRMEINKALVDCMQTLRRRLRSEMGVDIRLSQPDAIAAMLAACLRTHDETTRQLGQRLAELGGLQPGKAQPAKVIQPEPVTESAPLASVTIPPAVQAQSGSVRIYRGQRVYA